MQNLLYLRNKILFNCMYHNKEIEPKWKKPLKDLSPKVENIYYELISTLKESGLTIQEPPKKIINLSPILSKYPAYAYVKSNRQNYIKSIGEEVIKDNIYNIILNGTNYRKITEDETKSKIITANLELIKLINYIPEEIISDPEALYLSVGMQILIETKASNNFLICSWFLGTTKKGYDNIIGTNPRSLLEYCINYANIAKTIVTDYKEKYDLSFKKYLIYIAIGSQTSTIRGSMKSMSGKLFEHLILGSSLTVLGMNYSKEALTESDYIATSTPIFWLSSTEENNGREKDATILFKEKLINIDIGLIGKGNPEIISDKLTRYRSKIETGTMSIDEKTIILVGEKNNGGTIDQAAKDVSASVIQIIDNPKWIYELAQSISEYFNIDLDEITNIKSKIDKLDLNIFL